MVEKCPFCLLNWYYSIYVNGCFIWQVSGDGCDVERPKHLLARVSCGCSGVLHGNFCHYQWGSALAQTRFLAGAHLVWVEGPSSSPPHPPATPNITKS